MKLLHTNFHELAMHVTTSKLQLQLPLHFGMVHFKCNLIKNFIQPSVKFAIVMRQLS